MVNVYNHIRQHVRAVLQVVTLRFVEQLILSCSAHLIIFSTLVNFNFETKVCFVPNFLKEQYTRKEKQRFTHTSVYLWQYKYSICNVYTLTFYSPFLNWKLEWIWLLPLVITMSNEICQNLGRKNAHNEQIIQCKTQMKVCYLVLLSFMHLHTWNCT